MWEPRVPLVLAESVVDFPRIDEHIVTARARLERRLTGPAKAYADSLDLHAGIASMRWLGAFERALYDGLAQTFLFGHREAARELAALREFRDEQLVPHPNPLPMDPSPFLRRQSALGTRAFARALDTAWARYSGDFHRGAQLRDRAYRAAHNITLELIGIVLNAGRTQAALGDEQPIIAALPPARYAMRSEQLDSRTCTPCDHLHGRVEEVGTPEYFALSPPNYCLGRGRCRGVWVYGDSPSDFLTLPVPQQRRLPL